MKTGALLLSLLVTLVGCPVWAEDAIVTGPDRRHEIDLRIEELDAQRAEISTEDPRVATFLGVALMVGGAIAFAVEDRACRDEFGDCDNRVGTIAGITLLSLGGAMAIAGGAVWARRVHRRNAIDAERESLIEERNGVAAALSRIDLASAHRDHTHFVTLGLRF